MNISTKLRWPVAGALSLGLSCSVVTPTFAKGCLKGAAGGAVVGHVAGHHAIAGAVGGCALGHHLAHKKMKKQKASSSQ